MTKKQLIKHLGLKSQGQLARYLGISKQAVSKVPDKQPYPDSWNERLIGCGLYGQLIKAGRKK